MKTNVEKAEYLADKMMVIAKEMDIQFIHGYEEMRKELIEIFLTAREEDIDREVRI